MKTEWWQTFFTGIALDLWRQAVTPERTRAEADFILKVLNVPPQSHLLDVPCGNGRLSLELASRGYQMSGVDIAEEFVQEARRKAAERNLKLMCEHRDMRDLPWQAKFDGAFCLGNSFGYLDDDGNLKFLHAAARVLKPGARFLIDAPVAESLLPKLQERFWLEVGDILFLIYNRYDHDSGRLETEYTFIRDGRVDKRSGSQRLYTYRELHSLLQKVGFINMEAYSTINLDPFVLGAQHLFLTGTKDEIR